jgi:hypothetical protein
MMWVKAIVMSVILSILLTGIVRGWQERDDE